MDIKRIWSAEEVFHLPESDTRFYGSLGLDRYEELADGSMRVPMRITHSMLNGHGTAQGGAIASLCDIAGAAYMCVLVGNEVTLNSSMQFYRPAKEDSVVTAVAGPRKLGKTICTVSVEVRDEAGTLLADSLQTFFRIGEDA